MFSLRLQFWLLFSFLCFFPPRLWSQCFLFHVGKVDPVSLSFWQWPKIIEGLRRQQSLTFLGRCKGRFTNYMAPQPKKTQSATETEGWEGQRVPRIGLQNVDSTPPTTETLWRFAFLLLLKINKYQQKHSRTCAERYESTTVSHWHTTWALHQQLAVIRRLIFGTNNNGLYGSCRKTWNMMNVGHWNSPAC